jgi:hypothetical protein
MRRTEDIKPPTLSRKEPLDKVLPCGPHTQALSVYIHGDRQEHAQDLNQPNVDEHALAPIRLEPMREEQRKHKPVENVCRVSQISKTGALTL